MLEEARALGFLGPGPVAGHITHAAAFAAAYEAVGGTAPEAFLDLGSGGGIPGLPLARRWDAASAVLLDANERRTAWLGTAVAALDLQLRVEVRRNRAEVAGRTPDLRGSFGLVTARSFGPPAVTAECGAPFLSVGGVLLVSEPPDEEPRWDPDALALLGLEPVGVRASPARIQVLRQATPCPERFPRREGVPAKRPLF